MTATWEQVAVSLGRPASTFTAEQQAQITWWLSGVDLVIKNRLGDLADLDPANLKFVEVEATADKARRHLVPESSITVSVDDGSVTRRYEYPVTDSDITDEWWELLASAYSPEAFTIKPWATRSHSWASGWCW